MVSAFKGTVTTSAVYDASTGTSNAGGYPVQTGSITPSHTGELLVAGLYGEALPNATLINSGFTVLDLQKTTSPGGADSYLVGYNTAAIDPIWSCSGASGYSAAAIATFKHP